MEEYLDSIKRFPPQPGYWFQIYPGSPSTLKGGQSWTTQLCRHQSKMLPSKKSDLYRDFAAGGYLSVQYPLLPITRTGGGERVEPEKRGERQQITKLGRKY